MICVLLLVTICLQFSASDSRVELAKSNFGRTDAWRLLSDSESTVNPLDLCELTFALQIRDADLLDAEVKAVSTPGSPRYADYLSLDQIAAKYGPSNASLARLQNWFAANGIAGPSYDTTVTRDFITARVPVHTVERMFRVKMEAFVHVRQGVRIVRSRESFTVPSHVAPLIALVYGINNFPNMESRMKLMRPVQVKKRQGGAVTPQVIWETFNTFGTKNYYSGNLQAVAQFLQQYYLPSDLATYQSNYNLNNTPISKVIGYNNVSNVGMEATLDVQFITATALGTPTWFYSTAGTANGGQERFLLWAQTMNNESHIPYVVSISYGDTESSIDTSYINRLEIEFKKLAVRGTTLLFSSGDDGVGCANNCINQPNWPASSPMVTAVGGFFQSNVLVGDSISSGGFSNVFATPDFQRSAVQAYLANKSNNIPPASQFNAAGRAFPDVAAYSEGCEIVFMGSFTQVGGTSCAAPTIGGLIALINDYLLLSGKKSVGYINPALYKFGASPSSRGFQDITEGNNNNDCCAGFNCATGWDPVTGWGAPDFYYLRLLFVKLQQ